VELTTLDEAVVMRCKKLLYYPKRYQDMMLDADPDKRVKADFFIELYSVITDRDLKKMSWFRRDRFIDQMLEKYLIVPKIIKSVTDFRLIKQHMSNARKAGKISQLSSKLHRFAKDREIPIESLELREAKIHAAASKLVRDVVRIKTAIGQMDVESYYGEGELWDELVELVCLLQQKLREADRRF
jgi:hypothetical protein